MLFVRSNLFPTIYNRLARIPLYFELIGIGNKNAGEVTIQIEKSYYYSSELCRVKLSLVYVEANYYLLNVLGFFRCFNFLGRKTIIV